MNGTFLLSQLRAALLAIVAYAAGKGWLTPTDATFATAMVTTLGPILAPFLLSAYSNFGVKKVPQNSIAVENSEVHPATNVVGNTAYIGTAKIVGALLFALILFGAAPSAFAQQRSVAILAPSISTAVIIQKIADDSAAALADARDHNDTIAANCYAAINNLSVAKVQAANVTGGGALLVFQKGRDLVRLSSTPQGTDLIVGCAALVQDAKLNMLQFFTSIGATALLKGILIP